MSNLNTKLDRFAAAIVAEASADTQQALAVLTEKRSAAYAAAEEQILNEVYHHIHSEVGRIKSETGRNISRHMLENKRALYLRRETISEEVFGKVRERIGTYTDSPAYRIRLAAILVNALAALGNPGTARVFLRVKDAHLADALAASRPGVTLTFFDGDFALGGLVADAPALGKRVDATFDSEIEQLSGCFAELFGLSLPSELDEEEVTHG